MDADSLMAAFEGLVLERTPSGAFVCVSRIPAWYRPREGVELEVGEEFDVEEAFPVLATFLPEAERAWAHGRRAISTLWTEPHANGQEVHLEAIALFIGPAPVLAITPNERLFRSQQAVLSRARELRLAHRSLVREMEAKDVLVHAIVHDLGAPLHSILGALTLLEEQSLDAQSRSWVQLGLSAATRQRAMIRDILEVFSAEQGALESLPEPSRGADVCAAMWDTVRELGPVAQQKGVRFEVTGCDAPLPIVGEDTRLHRVLANLVENALRYAPSGTAVRLRAARAERSVEAVVEDEGAGVPESLRSRLFEKFARDRARSSGMGLGLYFCRITVERWGGRISYEPREGGGSRFRMSLPSARPERAEDTLGRRSHG
jgi:signal transduction histidine kinase